MLFVPHFGHSNSTAVISVSWKLILFSIVMMDTITAHAQPPQTRLEQDQRITNDHLSALRFKDAVCRLQACGRRAPGVSAMRAEVPTRPRQCPLCLSALRLPGEILSGPQMIGAGRFG